MIALSILIIVFRSSAPITSRMRSLRTGIILSTIACDSLEIPLRPVGSITTRKTGASSRSLVRGKTETLSRALKEIRLNDNRRTRFTAVIAFAPCDGDTSPRFKHPYRCYLKPIQPNPSPGVRGSHARRHCALACGVPRQLLSAWYPAPRFAQGAFHSRGVDHAAAAVQRPHDSDER